MPQRERDAAVAACTVYLAVPSLKPAQAALARMLRAQAYLGQRKLVEALADYDAATRATPAEADAWTAMPLSPPE